MRNRPSFLNNKKEVKPADQSVYEASNGKTNNAYPDASSMQQYGFKYDDAVDDTVPSGLNDGELSNTYAMSAASAVQDSDAAGTLDERDSDEQYHDATWYDTTGRVGRAKLLAYSFIWGLLFTILLLVAAVAMGGIATAYANVMTGVYTLGLIPIVVLLLCLPILIYIYVVLPKRRLHDTGMSGWWLLFWLVPLANLYLLYLLYIKPGDAGVNQYGLPAAPNTAAEKGLATLAIVASLMAVVLPVVGANELYQQFMLEPAGQITAETDADAAKSVVDDPVTSDTTTVNLETNNLATDGAEPSVIATDTSTNDASNATADREQNTEQTPGVPSANTINLNAANQNQQPGQIIDNQTNTQANTQTDASPLSNDPAVQAAIDAALNNTLQNDADTTGAENGISYEQFKALSDTRIMIEDAN